MAKWELLEEKQVGDFDVFTVDRLKSKSPRDGKVYEYHIIRRSHCVQVIPITMDGKVILVEQFRHAVQKPSLEFPAGSLEPDEDAAEGALRELEEETGYCAKRHEVIAVLDPDTALVREGVSIIVAYDCTPTGKKNMDAGEDVQTKLYTPAEVEELIRSGKITLAITIAAWAIFQNKR